MKIYKKLLALVMAIMVTFVFTGCMTSNNEVTVRADESADVYVDFNIDKTKMENITYDMMLEIAKAAADENTTEADIKKEAKDSTKDFMESFEEGLLEGGEFNVEKTGGSEFYTMKADEKNVSIKEAGNIFKEYDSKAWLSARAFNLDMSEFIKEFTSEEMDDAVDNVAFDISFKITFPYAIVKTNGDLSADKKTVEWSCTSVKDNFKLYAYAADKVKPVITGVKNGKSYKGKVTVKVSDKDSGVKSAVIKNIKTGKTYAKFTGIKKVTKKGRYLVTVTDNMSNKKTAEFTIK